MAEQGRPSQPPKPSAETLDLRQRRTYWSSVWVMAHIGFFSFGFRHLLAIALVLAVFAVQLAYGVITESSLQQKWLSIALPYVAILAAGYIFQLARAARLLHEEYDAKVYALEFIKASLESEVSRLRDVINKPTKPRVVLDYIDDAQGSRFVLANRGGTDATNVQVSNLVNGERWLRWRWKSQILHGNDASVEIWTMSGPAPNGVRHVQPGSSDYGYHRAALEWMLEPGSPDPFWYEGSVQITFDDEFGKPCDPVDIIIGFDLVTKEVYVAQAASDSQMDPVPQSMS
jgi:hypothetical protein